MSHACAKGALSALALSLAACGPKTGPGGVHEGDYFYAKLESSVVADGFVSGWVGDRWIEVHKRGDLVQRIDLHQVAAFKVRCSHE